MSSIALEEKKCQDVTASFHFGFHMAFGLQLPCQSCMYSVSSNPSILRSETDKSVLHKLQKITNKSGETEKNIQKNLKALFL
jgi:hypothetical protein